MTWRDEHFNVHKIIAYHGSANKFNHFDFSYIDNGTGDGGMYGPGFYFTESPELAKEWNEKGYLYKVELTFDNPYVLHGGSYENEKFSDLIHAEYDEEADKNTNDMTDFFKAGYDSVVSLHEEWANPEDENDVEYHDQYVAFKDGQIRILEVEEY